MHSLFFCFYYGWRLHIMVILSSQYNLGGFSTGFYCFLEPMSWFMLGLVLYVWFPAD